MSPQQWIDVAIWSGSALGGLLAIIIVLSVTTKFLNH